MNVPWGYPRMTNKETRIRYSIHRDLLCVCALVLGEGVHAEVTLDGTLGPAGPLTGPDYEIPARVG